MIRGSVNNRQEAIIPLVVLGEDGQVVEIQALIDTGFTGFLTLPSNLISALGMEWRGRAQALLADGSLHVFEVYAGSVVWMDTVRMVETEAVDAAPLVGMGLLHGHELRVEVAPGRVVTIQEINTQPLG